jgi:hypothetical protein
LCQKQKSILHFLGHDMGVHHATDGLDGHNLEGSGKAVRVVSIQRDSGRAIAHTANVAGLFDRDLVEDLLLLDGTREGLAVILLVSADGRVGVIIFHLGRVAVLRLLVIVARDRDRNNISLDGIAVSGWGWEHSSGLSALDHAVCTLEGFDGFLGEEAIADVHLSRTHLGIAMGKHAAGFVGAEALSEEATAHLGFEALGKDVALVLEWDVNGGRDRLLLLHGDVLLVSLRMVLIIVERVVVMVVRNALNVEKGSHFDFIAMYRYKKRKGCSFC